MNHDRLRQIELNLRDNAINVRQSALKELASVPSAEALPILHRLARDDDFALRKVAVMGLGNHLTEESWQILEDVVQTERDSNVLAEAANSLFEFGERAIAPLQELFTNSDNWLVRQTIISILVDSDRPEVLFQVAQLAIADRDQTTKETGILALSRLLDTSLKQPVLKLFATLSEDGYWRNRWRAAIALTASRDPQARALLTKLRQDDHYRVVAATLES